MPLDANTSSFALPIEGAGVTRQWQEGGPFLGSVLHHYYSAQNPSSPGETDPAGPLVHPLPHCGHFCKASRGHVYNGSDCALWQLYLLSRQFLRLAPYPRATVNHFCISLWAIPLVKFLCNQAGCIHPRLWLERRAILQRSSSFFFPSSSSWR